MNLLCKLGLHRKGPLVEASEDGWMYSDRTCSRCGKKFIVEFHRMMTAEQIRAAQIELNEAMNKAVDEMPIYWPTVRVDQQHIDNLRAAGFYRFGKTHEGRIVDVEPKE